MVVLMMNNYMGYMAKQKSKCTGEEEVSDRKRNGKGTRLSAGYTVYKEAVWLSICKIQRPTTHAVAVAWPRQKTIGCQIIQRSDLWL